ncbi:hypothetical protein [Streptomyces sp. NPDC093094]|uniref:hypothetical protein n=1 Tax=Streptomyces sp. NPDC093094 TaxID=3366026 RepID=UPI003815CB59
MGQALETSTRPRVRIEIDLNARDEEGRVPAYLADADGYLAVGDAVTAFESEDEVAVPAVVRKIAHGVAYLDVDWTAMTDDIPTPVARPATAALSERRQSTSSGASWVRIKVMAPILAGAAVAAASVGMTAPSSTTAPNSVSLRDAATALEAGDTT